MDAKRKRRLIVFAAAIGIAALALFALWRYTPVRDVLTVRNITLTIDAISAWWWGPIALLLAYTLACFILFPRPLITVAAVMVYGMVKGFAIAMTGVLLAAVVLYFIGRRIEKKRLQKLAGAKLDRISRVLRKEGFLPVALLGLLPVAPFPLEMAVLGTLRVKLRDLLLGVAIANTPGILGATVVGDQVMAAITDGREVSPALIAIVVIAFIAIVAVSHRMWRRMEAAAA